MNRTKTSSIDVLAKNLINAKSKKLLLETTNEQDTTSTPTTTTTTTTCSTTHTNNNNSKLMSSMNEEFESNSPQQKQDNSKLNHAPSSPSSLSSSSSTSSTLSSSSNSTTSQIASAMQALFQSSQSANLAALSQALSVKDLAKLNLQDSTNLLAANLLQLQQQAVAAAAASSASSSSPVSSVTSNQTAHSLNRKQTPQKRTYNKSNKKNLDDIISENLKPKLEIKSELDEDLHSNNEECSSIQQHDNNTSMHDDYNDDDEDNDLNELDEEDDELNEMDKRDRNNSTSSPTRSSSSQDQSRSISPSTVFNDSSSANSAAYPNLASLAASNALDTSGLLSAGLNFNPQTSGLLASAAAAVGSTPNGATTGDLNSLSLISDAAAALITGGNLPNAALPTPANSVANLIASTRKRRTDREQASERVKKIKPVPDDKKDDAYWERRRKNNEAAKRSRDLRRQKEDEIAIRASFLEQENLKLKAQVTILKAELSKLHFMLYNR